jgi:hypothetical protein
MQLDKAGVRGLLLLPYVFAIFTSAFDMDVWFASRIADYGIIIQYFYGRFNCTTENKQKQKPNLKKNHKVNILQQY